MSVYTLEGLPLPEASSMVCFQTLGHSLLGTSKMRKQKRAIHTIPEANAFKRWLRARGEDAIADHIRTDRWRPHTGMDVSDSGEEERQRHNKLKAEFDKMRRESAEADQKKKEAAAAVSAIPEAEIKKRVFPKRYVRKGIAG